MPSAAPLPVLGWAGSAIEIAVNKTDKYLIALRKREVKVASCVNSL